MLRGPCALKHRGKESWESMHEDFPAVDVPVEGKGRQGEGEGVAEVRTRAQSRVKRGRGNDEDDDDEHKKKDKKELRAARADLAKFLKRGKEAEADWRGGSFAAADAAFLCVS